MPSVKKSACWALSLPAEIGYIEGHVPRRRSRGS
jgi:hypothetical protein